VKRPGSDLELIGHEGDGRRRSGGYIIGAEPQENRCRLIFSNVAGHKRINVFTISGRHFSERLARFGVNLETIPHWLNVFLVHLLSEPILAQKEACATRGITRTQEHCFRLCE
jgi:hypothetical protein